MTSKSGIGPCWTERWTFFDPFPCFGKSCSPASARGRARFQKAMHDHFHSTTRGGGRSLSPSSSRLCPHAKWGSARIQERPVWVPSGPDEDRSFRQRRMTMPREVVIFDGLDPAELDGTNHAHHGRAQHSRASFMRRLLADSRPGTRHFRHAAWPEGSGCGCAARRRSARTATLGFSELASWPDVWTPPVIHCLGIGLAGALHLSCAFPHGVCQSP
jgi:hypothetical protein